MLDELASSQVGPACGLATILHMLCSARAMEFVPSEWEGAVCESDTLHIRYEPNELICQRGSYVAGIQLVLSGVASEFLQMPNESRSRPDLLGSGDLIGIEVLAETASETSGSACAAITGVELLFFERRAFNRQLLRNPALSLRILRYLAYRHMRLQGSVRHVCSDLEALGQLLLRLDDLCADSDQPELVMLPEAIELRTLQQLAGLTGRRFRSAWDAIDTLDIIDSRIAFRRDVLLQLVYGASDARAAV